MELGPFASAARWPTDTKVVLASLTCGAWAVVLAVGVVDLLVR